MGKFLRENQIDTIRKKQSKKISNLNEKEICDIYVDGKSIRDLEKLYQVSDSVIKSILKKNNIQMRTNSESHTKYSLDNYYFQKIDCPNKAYLLGFICADGFVTDTNVIGIGLQKRDYALLDFFKKEIQSNKPIIEKENIFDFRVQNKIFADILKSYSIIPNKSLVLDIGVVIKKASIPENLISYFLLGYFDGDGGIYQSKNQFSCSVTGTFETCNYFKEYFNKIGFFTKRHKDDKNNYTYQIGGRNQVRKALSKLYTGLDSLDFFYERKYAIFCKL